MSNDPDHLTSLAHAWDEAAEEYERYFVPRFSPWVGLAVSAITATPLPSGPILVPCCGTFPELPWLIEHFPDREFVGLELSAGMAQLARERAAGLSNVRVVEGDATLLDPEWSSTCAGVVSVFGLQQLPEPETALRTWVTALRTGGRLSVIFWPGEIEEDGPFALADYVLTHNGSPRGDSWQHRVGASAGSAGSTVERHEYRSFPMSHPDAETFWTAMTRGGPLRTLANRRGERYMLDRRDEFLDLAPTGPWHHRPRAQWITARR